MIVNYRKRVDKAGIVTAAPLTSDQMEQIKVLVKEALGFSAARGDSVDVVNTVFNEPTQQAPIEVPLWRQPETISIAKGIAKFISIGALVLYLFLGVLKPFLRQIAMRPPRPALVPPVELADGSSGSVIKIDHLQSARQLARQEPRVVANVVKTWVSGNE